MQYGLARPTRREWLRSSAAGALALAGCARNDGSGPLRFWAMGREGEVANGLLAGFAREHPGLEVRVEQLPWSAAHEKLLTAFAGDATPDVAQLGNTWIAELAALGALEPLQPWIDAASATPAAAARGGDATGPGRPDADRGLRADDYFNGIWETNRVGGTLYGLPWYVDTRLLFYRRDLFDRAGVAAMPDTWDGFARALEALQRSGTPHPLLLPSAEFEPLLALALQQDEPLLRDGGRWGNFRGAGFERALSFYMERFASGQAPTTTGGEIANLWQEFGRGTFAAFISGPWNIGELDRRLPPELRRAWATAPLPGPTGPGASTAGGSSLVVFRRSKRRADALRLLAYLSRPAVQLRLYAMTGDMPPRRSAWAQPPLADDTRAAAFAQQLERAKAAPAVPEWERIAQEMQLVATRAVHERWSVERAAATLDARVDGFLAKRRWMLERRAA